jgi:hypothetical protein
LLCRSPKNKAVTRKSLALLYFIFIFILFLLFHIVFNRSFGRFVTRGVQKDEEKTPHVLQKKPSGSS